MLKAGREFTTKLSHNAATIFLIEYTVFVNIYVFDINVNIHILIN